MGTQMSIHGVVNSARVASCLVKVSFRGVVDSARVASCLIKVSFCGIVDSAPQTSFREVVDSACGTSNTREHIQDV